MKNKTTAAGGDPRRKMRSLTWSTLCDGSRWQAFRHSRLWLGLLPAAALGFGIVFLVALAAGFEPAGKALAYGLLAGTLNGFGWILGIWAAVGPDEEGEGEEEENEDDGAEAKEGSAPARFGRLSRLAAWLWVAGLLFLSVAFSDVTKLLDGTESWSKAAVSITAKALVLLAVSIPIGLAYRKR